MEPDVFSKVPISAWLVPKTTGAGVLRQNIDVLIQEIPEVRSVPSELFFSIKLPLDNEISRALVFVNESLADFDVELSSPVPWLKFEPIETDESRSRALRVHVIGLPENVEDRGVVRRELVFRIKGEKTQEIRVPITIQIM